MTELSQTELSVVGLVLLIAAAPVAWHLMRGRHLAARIGMLLGWAAA